MKIAELFDKSLNPKWELIWTLEPFKACVGVKQNTDWHRETVDKHIRSVTEHMQDIINGNAPEWLIGSISSSDKLGLMAAALCHDLGKPSTTKWDDGLKQWKCKNHGVVGERITRKWFFDESDIYLRETVCSLVRWHMDLHHLSDKPEDVQQSKIRFLSHSFAKFQDFIALYICDCLGSDNKRNDENGWVEDMAFARKCLDVYNEHADEWVRFTTNEEPDVIIMMGISGSGKSTWTEQYAKEHDYKILSRDTIREELGMVSSDKKYKGNKSQEDKVSKLFNERLVQYVQNGAKVIIDNMNLQERYRKAYKELLNEYELKWGGVYVEAPTIEECVKRRQGMMPEGEIEKMLDRFDFPRHYEFDSLKLIKQQAIVKE